MRYDYSHRILHKRIGLGPVGDMYCYSLLTECLFKMDLNYWNIELDYIFIIKFLIYQNEQHFLFVSLYVRPLYHKWMPLVYILDRDFLTVTAAILVLEVKYIPFLSFQGQRFWDVVLACMSLCPSLNLSQFTLDHNFLSYTRDRLNNYIHCAAVCQIKVKVLQFKQYFHKGKGHVFRLKKPTTI